MLHPRREVSGLTPALVIWQAHQCGLFLLLHHEALALPIAQIELRDGGSFRRPFVRGLNCPKVLYRPSR
jgi:hypothetical protein